MPPIKTTASPATYLFGTDFSVASRAALLQAANLAVFAGARLVIAHVRPDPRAPAPGLVDASGARTTGDAISEALDGCCRVAREHGAEAEPVTLMGYPPEELSRHAAEIGADALIVGSLGRTGIEHFLLGSIAEQTARRAPCVVVVARADTAAADGYRNALVATDFSAAAAAALAAACELAAVDGRIELFHVATPPSSLGVGLGSGPVTPAVDREIQESIDAAMAARIERHRSARVRIEQSRATGPIASKILDKLEERAFDLVALGSHGRSGLKRLLLGSTAEKVIRHAPCSALVYPTAALEDSD
jgi:nucleotide-binding universal stress UspA family protein